jgi:flagellar hook-length control protein FliK
LSQVLPITNETPIATESSNEASNIQRSNDNFSELLEQEKRKVLLSAMVPVNFQSLFDTPLFSSTGTDKTASKIESYFGATNSYRQNSIETSRASNKPSMKTSDTENEHSVKAAETPKDTKAEQLKFAASAVNKIYEGEIELSADLYSAVIKAKNRIDSLRSIDVDDLLAQIKNKIKLLVENGGSKLSIELKPENLGTILMSVSSNKGLLSINIYADQAAKKVLEDNIAELKRSLELSNLNIENLNVLSDDRREHNKGENS